MTPLKNGGIEADMFDYFTLIKDTHQDYLYVNFGHKDGGFVMYPTSDRKPGYNPQALESLDSVVQQNASSAEELASMTEELNAQAEVMTDAV